jgi:hypothetical protein
MWRAWGTFLLLISSQDLDRPFVSEDHEMTLRPPAGWARRAGQGPFVVRFTAPDEVKPPCDLTVTHLVHTTNPTPLRTFVQTAKEHIAKEFKGSKVTEEKELKLGGRAAYRIVFTFEGTIQVKTVVHRTNLEWYLLDASIPEPLAPKLRPLAEASIATFELAPAPLSVEERAARGRTLDALRAAKVAPGLLGERWFAVHLGTRKVGHQRVRLTESEGLYALESDTVTDFGEGNRDATIVRASFSPDGRVQKVDTEQTKTNDRKERWQFRASAVLQNGQVKASRDMNGVKEERSFAAEEGVLFGDVADVVRRALVGAGKGSYLLLTLSPFVDEPNVEFLEVNDREAMELDGRSVEAHLVFAKVDRRRTKAYYYGADQSLIREGGLKEAFSVRASTKEEALK